jgi:hypothetical protein
MFGDLERPGARGFADNFVWVSSRSPALIEAAFSGAYRRRKELFF